MCVYAYVFFLLNLSLGSGGAEGQIEWNRRKGGMRGREGPRFKVPGGTMLCIFISFA